MILVILLFYVYVLFRKSRSTYFYNGKNMVTDFKLVIDICKINNFNEEELLLVRQAYNYFTINPEKFDGATIVADNYTIPNLSVTAMVHDFLCINIPNGKLIDYIEHRWYVDLQYFRMLQKVKRKWFVNTAINSTIFVLLTISTPIYYYFKKWN